MLQLILFYILHTAREMGVTAPWENTVDVPARRPIQVSNGVDANGRDLQPTERDGLVESSDVERDRGTSRSTSNHPTPVEDNGMCFNNMALQAGGAHHLHTEGL